MSSLARVLRCVGRNAASSRLGWSSARPHVRVQTIAPSSLSLHTSRMARGGAPSQDERVTLQLLPYPLSTGLTRLCRSDGPLDDGVPRANWTKDETADPGVAVVFVPIRCSTLLPPWCGQLALVLSAALSRGPAHQEALLLYLYSVAPLMLLLPLPSRVAEPAVV